MTRDLDQELEDALNREASRTVRRDVGNPVDLDPWGHTSSSVGRSRDRHKDSRKVQVWVPEWLYDQCKELVGIVGGYNSLSELMRDGMEMALDKNIGVVEQAIAERTRGITPGSLYPISLNKGYGTVTADALWYFSLSPTDKGDVAERLERMIDSGMHIPIPYKGE
jgi:Arc/MetJ-type ribon-helix-helix transcriptional regulator